MDVEEVLPKEEVRADSKERFTKGDEHRNVANIARSQEVKLHPMEEGMRWQSQPRSWKEANDTTSPASGRGSWRSDGITAAATSGDDRTPSSPAQRGGPP